MGWQENPQRRRYKSMNSLHDIWNSPSIDWREEHRPYCPPEPAFPLQKEKKSEWISPEIWKPPVHEYPVESSSWKPAWSGKPEQSWSSKWKHAEPSASQWKPDWRASEPSWREQREDTSNMSWKTKDNRLRKTQSSTGLKEKRLIPNRFVSRQLKSHIRDPEKHPIGLFMWGFGDHVKVKDIMQTFAEYGDFNNGNANLSSRHFFQKWNSLLFC
jgi:hypothetical protein